MECPKNSSFTWLLNNLDTSIGTAIYQTPFKIKYAVASWILNLHRTYASLWCLCMLFSNIFLGSFELKQVSPKENLSSIQFNIHLYKDNWFGNLNGCWVIFFLTKIIIMNSIRIWVAGSVDIGKKCSVENSRSRLAPNERNQLTSKGTYMDYIKTTFVVWLASPLYCIKHMFCKEVYLYVVGVAN